jgi:hypothetical protein
MAIAGRINKETRSVPELERKEVVPDAEKNSTPIGVSLTP